MQSSNYIKNILDFPNEILFYMLSFVDPRDLGRFSQVCSQTRDLLNTNQIWAATVRKHFPCYLKLSPDSSRELWVKFIRPDDLRKTSSPRIIQGPVLQCTQPIGDPSQTHDILKFYQIPRNNRAMIFTVQEQPDKKFFFQEQTLKISEIKSIEPPHGFDHQLLGHGENIYQICKPYAAKDCDPSAAQTALFEQAYVRIWNADASKCYCSIPLAALATEPVFDSERSCSIDKVAQRITQILGVNDYLLAYLNADQSITLFVTGSLEKIQDVSREKYSQELATIPRKQIPTDGLFCFSQGKLYHLARDQSYVHEYRTFEPRKVPIKKQFNQNAIDGSLQKIGESFLLTCEEPKELFSEAEAQYYCFDQSQVFVDHFISAFNIENVDGDAIFNEGIVTVKGNYLAILYMMSNLDEVPFTSASINTKDEFKGELSLQWIFPDEMKTANDEEKVRLVREQLADRLCFCSGFSVMLEIKGEEKNATVLVYKGEKEAAKHELGALGKDSKPRLLGFDAKNILFVDFGDGRMTTLQFTLPEPGSEPKSQDPGANLSRVEKLFSSIW